VTFQDNLQTNRGASPLAGSHRESDRCSPFFASAAGCEDRVA